MIDLSQEKKEKVRQINKKLKSRNNYIDEDKYLVAATEYDMDNMNKLLSYLNDNPNLSGEEIQNYIFSEIVNVGEYNLDDKATDED